MPVGGKRRVKIPLATRMLDGPLGPIRVLHDSWPSVILQVDGPGLPTVRVPPDRDAKTVFVNGQRHPLQQPRPFALRRRSRRYSTTVDGRVYVFAPRSFRSSQLLRDGIAVAEVRGTLAVYSPFHHLPGLDARITWCGAPDPLDVALGQALVIVFGAGSGGFLTNLVIGLVEFFN